MRRPLATLTPEELRGLMQHDAMFKKYWEALEPMMRRHNYRGVTKWQFYLGYLAGQQARRDQLEAVPGAVEKALAPLLRSLEAQARFYRVD